MLIENESLMQ